MKAFFLYFNRTLWSERRDIKFYSLFCYLFCLFDKQYFPEMDSRLLCASLFLHEVVCLKKVCTLRQQRPLHDRLNWEKIKQKELLKTIFPNGSISS